MKSFKNTSPPPLIIFLRLSLKKSAKIYAEKLLIIIYHSKQSKTIKCSTI